MTRPQAPTRRARGATGPPPTAQATVAETLGTRLPNRRFVVVSNREPYVHKRTKQGVEVERPPGGLVEALDPVVQAVGGLWIAWGSGNADREVVDDRDRVPVPPREPRYTLRRVWLPEKIVDRYYYGYANQALWPLCHLAVEKARFVRRFWHGYIEANHRFAEAVVEEAAAGAFVWLQDYHLALCPRLVRAQRPDLILSHFWHIPWPAWDIYRACPQAQRRALLEGLLGNDLLGFHVDRFRENFLDCVGRELDADIDADEGLVDYAGHRTTVRTFPISVDARRFEEMAHSPAGERWMRRWRARPEVGDRRVLIGVDRLDYTKGIPERLRAIARFFRVYPRYRGRVVFVQKAAASRTRIKAYQELQDTVEALVTEVNQTFGTPQWTPVLYVPEAVSRVGLAALYRLADAAVVSSLQDGMNLVAKEFVACQVEERGVLLLSELSGAAQEFAQAVPINPFDQEGFADALARALEMPAPERQRRMQAMRAYLREHDVYRWMEEIVIAVSHLLARREEPRPLFEDLAVVEAARRTRRLALFLDYDGTIVPIAPTPAQAVASEEVRATLRRLRDRGLEVVIVTGRAAEDVRRLLGVEGIAYFGNHGLELRAPGEAVPPIHEAAERLRAQVHRLVGEIRTALAEVPGVVLEDKGLSASVHYRLVPEEDVPRVRQVVAVLAEHARPWVRLMQGKKVLELRPDLRWDKGRAVLWWLEHRFGPDWEDRVLPVCIGDDRTDEDIFAALAGRGITVAVAPRGPTAAAYSLGDPGQVVRFLGAL